MLVDWRILEAEESVLLFEKAYLDRGKKRLLEGILEIVYEDSGYLYRDGLWEEKLIKVRKWLESRSLSERQDIWKWLYDGIRYGKVMILLTMVDKGELWKERIYGEVIREEVWRGLFERERKNVWIYNEEELMLF